MLSRCFLDFSVGVWAFVIGLSQISYFLSYCHKRARQNHKFSSKRFSLEKYTAIPRRNPVPWEGECFLCMQQSLQQFHEKLPQYFYDCTYEPVYDKRGL